MGRRRPVDRWDLPYRRVVGIMLINKNGHIWIGRRRPKWLPRDAPPVWQMPQGGIRDGETAREAALRELKEETGVRSIEIVGEITDWLTWELPDDLIGVALKGQYRGQRQRWVAMRFLGEDSEISLKTKGRKREFKDWRWASPEEVIELAISYRRPVYEKVLREFSQLLQPA
ncbi:MAG: RNA pyrophosphohydrolase [Hyphomicrobiaceae bacterium]